MVEQEHKDTPEERTAAFFDQDSQAIVNQLVNLDDMVIVVTGTDKKVRVIEAEAYPQVGDRYKPITDMLPGDLWSPPQRQILQSLIVTKNESDAGSCVRLKEVEYLDPATQNFVPTLRSGPDIYGPREGDIARFLGIGRYGRAALRFVDDSNSLHLIKVETTTRAIAPEDANNQLRGLLDGGSR